MRNVLSSSLIDVRSSSHVANSSAVTLRDIDPLPKRGYGKVMDEMTEEGRGLDSGEEGAVVGDVPVRHARRIEREAGIAVAIEEDEAAGSVGVFGEEMDGCAGGQRGARGSARNVGRVSTQIAGRQRKSTADLARTIFMMASP